MLGGDFVFDDLVGVVPALTGIDGFELAPVHRVPVVERVEAGDPPATGQDVVVALAQVDDGGGGVLSGVTAHLFDGVAGEQVYGVIAVGIADVGGDDVLVYVAI